MVVPALAALFTGAVGDLSCDFIPRARPYHADKLDKTLVGLTSPGKLGRFRTHFVKFFNQKFASNLTSQ